MRHYDTVLFSYTLIPARFPRIEGASGNSLEHHTSKVKLAYLKNCIG